MTRMVIALLVLSVCIGPAQAQKKSSKKGNTSAETQQKRMAFDIRKIVWPNPPEIARVKFEDILTGQKIDWEGLQSNKKPKLSWMDRLAGAQPDQQIKDAQSKVGFQLLRVYGVAADSKGNIYAADQAVGAIFIFPRAENGTLELIKNGEHARLPMINGLAMDDNDRLFVTDAKLHHVLVFNAAHEQEASFGGESLVSPAGIALDTTNRFVYVVDTQQDQVVVFDADNYQLLRRIGTGGKKHSLTGPGDFALPTNVAVDKDGNVYVTDTLNNRVEIFDADGSFLSEFGKPGDGPGHFARPKGIAVDGDGHIWVVDEVQCRVQVFNREGQLLIFFGERGWYPGQFQGVYGIAFDKANSRMITSEQFPGRVQVFRYVTDAEAAAEKARRGTKQSATAPKSVEPPAQKGGESVKEQGSAAISRP
ncbi:MAG TPA: 6-bladed beta-propeller [Candidatus Angelobacter sp.]|nr:6-bladed beta-propeller [Candidatus Angelobacter sp.]